VQAFLQPLALQLYGAQAVLGDGLQVPDPLQVEEEKVALLGSQMPA
jgi:hypothetical protein